MYFCVKAVDITAARGKRRRDAADTAVVLDQSAAEPLSLADRLGDFFSSILEYFR